MSEGTESQQQGELIQHPAKLLRITTMVRGLLEEVRQAPLDDSGRKRMREIYESSLTELKDALSENLQKELETLTIPLERTPSESEIRVAQAQLVGWLEGLLHGIKAAMWAQQMEAQAQLEEMQRRGLPGGQCRPRSCRKAARPAASTSSPGSRAAALSLPYARVEAEGLGLADADPLESGMAGVEQVVQLLRNHRRRHREDRGLPTLDPMHAEIGELARRRMVAPAPGQVGRREARDANGRRDVSRGGDVLA